MQGNIHLVTKHKQIGWQGQDKSGKEQEIVTCAPCFSRWAQLSSADSLEAEQQS